MQHLLAHPGPCHVTRKEREALLTIKFKVYLAPKSTQITKFCFDPRAYGIMFNYKLLNDSFVEENCYSRLETL